MPWAKVTSTIAEACRNDQITEDFWLFNDDFFIMKPVENMPAYYDRTLYRRIQQIEKKRKGTSGLYTMQLRLTRDLLQEGGYKIKVFNTINFAKSMHYNPLAYIRSEKDILKLVNTIIANTKGEGNQSGEDFWVKAERLYYCALIGYIWYEAPEEEQNLNTLIEMINASEAREDDENFENPIDILFKDLEERSPEHFAVRQYKKYKLAAGVV